jgi:amidohydrolase
MPHISSEVEKLVPNLIELRRDFHRHPELGFQEERSARVVAERLKLLGYTVRTGVGKTGVVGFLKGGKPGKTVLLRADIDALPIHEEATVAWKSETPGRMHACGHDANTAIGLTAAEILAKELPALSGNVLFIFQPAEEILSGAAAMLRDGALEGVTVDAAFAVHMQNEMPAGTVGLRSGPLMTSADRLDLSVVGKGGHGAFPHLASDPIMAAAQIITAVQTLVSRETPPLQMSVLSITTLKAGTAFNIIPDAVEMSGTFRCYDTDLRETLMGSLRRVAESVAAALKCKAEVRNEWLTPAVVNDPTLTRIVQELATEILGEKQVVEMQPLTGSDDIAYFWQKIPGCYAFVGSAKTDGSPVAQHHNAKFDIDESVMATGVDLLVRAARRVLESR